jgi:hypothetical protein
VNLGLKEQVEVVESVIYYYPCVASDTRTLKVMGELISSADRMTPGKFLLFPPQDIAFLDKKTM